MILGFTGTQSGMNEYQRNKFIEFLNQFNPNEFHHGDCIGADNDAHYAFLKWHTNNDKIMRKIVIHPPTNQQKRAFTTNQFISVKFHHSNVQMLVSHEKILTLLKIDLLNCKYKILIEELDDLPYLERNRSIVDACNVMIATPKEMEHTLRSGTWATVRYAWQKKKNIIIIPPLESEE